MTSNKNDTAVLTVIYSGCEKFLTDFFHSISLQNFQHYDLVIVNDNCPDWQRWNKNFPNERIKLIDGINSIAGNREIGINFALKQYKKLIFADADDLFSINRFQSCVELLEEHPIIVNEVFLMNDAGSVFIENYFSSRIKCGTKLYSDFFYEKNIAGMSNSAICTNCIKSHINIPEDLIAVDWFLFSQLLLDGNYIFFTCDSHTFYRQHDKNTIGFKNITQERLKQIIITKKNNYKYLSRNHGKFSPYLNYFSEMENKIKDNNFLKEMIKKIKEVNLLNPFWWEEVKYQN